MDVSNWAQKKKELDSVIKTGGTREDILNILNRPDNFHVCIGGLVIAAEEILPVIVDKILDKKGISTEDSKQLWNCFEREQEFCDEFFMGSQMRSYIIAKAWRQKCPSLKWNQLDEFLVLGGIDIQNYRSRGWMRVACFYNLAQKGFEDRAVFQSEYRSMNGDQRMAIVRALSRDELRNYQLRD